MRTTIASTDHAAEPPLHNVPVEMYEIDTETGGRRWCVDVAGQQVAVCDPEAGGRDQALGVYYFLKNCPPSVIEDLITFVAFTGHRPIEF